MSTKTGKSKQTGFRYGPDDLTSRDTAADEKFADDFIARNRDAINEDLKAARSSLKAGKGKAYASSEALTANIMSKVNRTLRKR